MKLQIKNNYIESTLTYLLFLVFAIFISNSFGLTMPDDGWRHLAMALYPEQVQTWQRIYPNTLYTDFDPWFMWHHLLAFISNFVDNSNIHVVINSIVYSLLSFWYYLAFTRFSTLNKYLILIFAIGLPMLSLRYFFLRPDILSGLFILYFLIINNKILLTLISILYAPFYYVFWFYFGYLTFVTFLLKDYKKTFILLFAAIFGFIFYFTYDFNGYMHIVQNVLNNDTLTQGYSVGESRPFILSLSFKNTLGSSILLIILSLFSALLFFVFKPKNNIFKYTVLFMPLIIIQYRFFHLLQPILYVFIIHILHKSYKIIEEYNLSYFINMIKEYIHEKSYLGKVNARVTKILVLFIIIVFFISTFFSNKKGYKKLETTFINSSFLKNDEFKNKLILLTSMDTSMYMATFLNPSGSYIPSCSIGWVNYNEKDKKIFFDLLINNQRMKINDFYIFLKKTNPDYLIIDTLKTTNLKFSNKEIEKNGYSFYKIINSKLIFRKIQ